ncbi:hypothetical protein CERSUDRAFT_110126 [Gelatoporia subvermispora B]|uniref:Spc7 kinetochore protein domain-containing protein n=1 Tax=Ceriporiopsis subvermispora (strain B) TaxID=914234 RepID=M2RRQ6_CERS8|nr:hypothetical protein CERSUDRAFT_110126 [Gelatoporia subvermispora B]
MPQKISPARRRSIAVLNQAPATRHANNRRRAYSIVPGEKLSPAALARRLKAPRKSILKASINLPPSGSRDEDEETSAGADSTNITQTMEFTQVHSAQPRKSLGRRVSFASHAHVRLFEIQDKDNNTASSAEAVSPPQDSPPQQSPYQDDQNVHFQASQSRRNSMRRRSSVAFSEFGERSMEMDDDETAPYPAQFLQIRANDSAGSALEDDDWSEDEDDDDEDMEITEAIQMNIARKRSLSLGGQSSLGQRRRSSVAPTTSSQSQSENQPPRMRESIVAINQQLQAHLTPGDLPGQDQSMVSEHSQSFGSEGASVEETQPMEFTVPMGRSLRPPEPPSDAWLGLRAITHAGDEPYELPPPDSSSDDGIPIPDSDPNDTILEGDSAMDLTDAIGRLVKARSSLGLPPVAAPLAENGNLNTDIGQNAEASQSLDGDQFGEDSFSSSDDSLGDMGDRTLNLTTIMQRTSLGTETSMENASIVNSVLEEDGVVRLPVVVTSPGSALPSTSTTIDSAAKENAPPGVFNAPQTTTGPSSIPKSPARNARSPAKPSSGPTVPKPFVFSLPRSGSARPTTPSKGASAPTPNPPSASRATTRTQPSPARATAAFAPSAAPKSPLKRPAPSDTDADHAQPSPAKRQAVGRLESAKKAPFESLGLQKPTSTPASTQNRRASISSARRPSGYFAQRKSLGANFPPAANTHSDVAPTEQTGGQDLRRVTIAPLSMGTTSSEENLRDGVTDKPLYPDLASIAEELPPTSSKLPSSESPALGSPRRARSCDREELRQAIAVPSPTRGSPSPASLRDNNTTGSPLNRTRSASPRVVATAPRKSIALTTGIDRVASTSGQSMEVDNAGSQQAAITQSTSDQPSVTTFQDDLDEEGPPITIEQFFSMTGIRFMDEITAPKPRPSTIPPIQLRARSRGRLSSESAPEEDPIPLAEFSVATAVEVPQYELYTAVVNDLNAWIEESKKICAQAEQESEKFTPALFREFADADESEKAILLHQLKLIKVNNHATAKSQWYDWKMQWVEQLYGYAEDGFASLETDAEMLAKAIQDAQAILPGLREEYAEVMAELEHERADIAASEASDPEYLKELKNTIAEQNAELDVFQADIAENNAKLQRLEEKSSEIESQKQEAVVAIAQAERTIHIQKESTSSEVFRLKDELEALQELHLWRVTKMDASSFECIYASRYHVSIPCHNHWPIPSKISISKTQASRTKERDVFPAFTELMLRVAQIIVRKMQDAEIPEIVQRLGDIWSCCTQLRSQFTFLAIKYPLSVDALERPDAAAPDLKVTATVMFPHAQGKAFVSFILDMQTYSTWPMSISSLKTEVKVAYGHIEQESILDAILGRLAQANSADNHGCLLDACIEATELYV